MMGLPNLLETRRGRKVAFFFLYLTEMLPQGFTLTAIATLMRREGVPPGQISAMGAFLLLPWGFKWVVAPFVDLVYSEYLGRRRGWITLTQVGMAVGMLAVIGFDYRQHASAFAWMMVMVNAFAATQDVAIDALACHVLDEKERGEVNGLMVAGASVGAAIGGSGALFLADFANVNLSLIVLAGCVLAITVFVVLPMRESPAPAPGLRSLRTAARQVGQYARTALSAFFGSRQALLALIFAVLPCGAYGISLVITNNLAVELGLSNKLVSLLALVSQITFAGGAVVGGYFGDRYGIRRVLPLYIVTTTVPTLILAAALYSNDWIWPGHSTNAMYVRATASMAGTAAIPQTGDVSSLATAANTAAGGWLSLQRPSAPWKLLAIFWATNLTFSFFQALLWGTRTALYMGVCNAAVAATQFTAYMSVLNLTMSYSQAWAGIAADRLGYPLTYAIDAAFGLCCIIPLFMLKRPDRKSPEEAPAK